MQYVADVLQIEVNRPKNLESTSLGAAYLAGLSVGFWTGKDIKAVHKLNRKFKASMSPKIAKDNYDEWTEVVGQIINSVKRK